MKDTIYREDAIKAIAHQGEIENDYTDIYHDGYCDGVFDAIDVLKDLPSAEADNKSPETLAEKLSLECEFCRYHACGDTLYSLLDWDSGIGFDCVRDIKYCPVCGRRLINGYTHRQSSN